MALNKENISIWNNNIEKTEGFASFYIVKTDATVTIILGSILLLVAP